MLIWVEFYGKNFKVCFWRKPTRLLSLVEEFHALRQRWSVLIKPYPPSKRPHRRSTSRASAFLNIWPYYYYLPELHERIRIAWHSILDMTSPKRPKKPSIPLTKVPSVKELFEGLGFQHASVKEETLFREACHSWRKSFMARSGRAGPELLSWNEGSIQMDLREMAERFLEDGDNAERFWSATRNWNHDSDLQYPEDKTRYDETEHPFRGCLTAYLFLLESSNS